MGRSCGKGSRVAHLRLCKRRMARSASELNWEIELTRQVLGEFAGMSEAELAAI